jgi:DNA-binding NtrC family response regulator
LALVKVLLVDDDETVRSGLQSALEASGFAVVVASNVKEALRIMTTGHFDVLLTDLHMPGAGDGLTVASAMRHINPSAVTILLSANPDIAEAAAAIREQIEVILLKPVSIDDMVDLIRKRLAQSAPQPLPGGIDKEIS